MFLKKDYIYVSKQLTIISILSAENRNEPTKKSVSLNTKSIRITNQ